MNVLLLLDLAPEFHDLLVGLGNTMNRRGHKTFYAIDSPINNWRFRENPPQGPSRIFSKFFADFDYSTHTITYDWEAFFPDFDRYENFGYNWGKKQEWYIKLGNALDAFFESCVKEWSIDLIIYECVTNSFSHFASLIAERHGIHYIGLQESRLPGRHELHGSSEDILRKRMIFNYALANSGIVNEKSIDKWVSEYLSNFEETTPDYMASNGLILQNPIVKYAKLKHLKNFYRLASYQILHHSLADLNYRCGPPLNYSLNQIKRNIVRWIRSKFINRYFSQPDVNDSYYLYPVHFHPESSTSVNSRWYVDEYPVIKNIAFSLPPGKWLYVKDHPSAVGLPTKDFYRRVSHLPNVKLIHPGANTKQLIRNSDGVVTQTGTAGYEALVLRKPVWVLGSVFYDFHPGCLKVGWDKALAESFRNPPQSYISEIDSLNLVKAYYLSTKPGSLPLSFGYSSPASLDQLVEEIEEQTNKF